MNKRERIIAACSAWDNAKSGKASDKKATVIERLARDYPLTFAQLIADGEINSMWKYVWARGGCSPLPEGVNDIYKSSIIEGIAYSARWWEKAHGKTIHLIEKND